MRRVYVVSNLKVLIHYESTVVYVESKYVHQSFWNWQLLQFPTPTEVYRRSDNHKLAIEVLITGHV